jgi:hypothetical protein
MYMNNVFISTEMLNMCEKTLRAGLGSVNSRGHASVPPLAATAAKPQATLNSKRPNKPST